jgi:hypothetical protein
VGLSRVLARPGRRSAVLAACAVAVLLTVAGCGSSTASTAAPGTARAVPVLTITQARSAFLAFADRDDRMTPASYVQALPRLTAPPDENSLLLAARHPLPSSLGNDDLRTARMRDPVFYVPRLTSYPLWFVVVGHAVHGSNALVMVRPTAAAPWRESMVINDQAPGAPLAASFRQVRLDQAGYAETAPAGSALMVSPARLATEYADLLAGSPAAARLFAPGAATTGWTAADQARAALAAHSGWQLRSGYRPAALPWFTLRGPAGGTLELFTVRAERTWTGVSAAPAISLGGGGLPIADVTAAGLTSARRGTTVRETDLYEMLAVIPAHGHGRVSLPLVYPLGGTYSVPEYGGGLAAVTVSSP